MLEDLLALIAEAVEKERRKKQAATQAKEAEPIVQKIAQQPKPRQEMETAHKAADLFNQNPPPANGRRCSVKVFSERAKAALESS